LRISRGRNDLRPFAKFFSLPAITARPARFDTEQGSMTAPPEDQRLQRWVREHGRAVRGYLLALVRRPEDADDLLQEVFRKAWLARERYDERGQERAYLMRIADRLACDWRRKKREVQLNGDDWKAVEPTTAANATVALEQEEWRGELQGALDSLSEQQQRVLLLRYYGELEFPAIAEQLALPLGTVLSHCHRGLAALRKLLTKEET
jgi:RNA polymerase sigma-70 factor (ECF subfamily)